MAENQPGSEAQPEELVAGPGETLVELPTADSIAAASRAAFEDNPEAHAQQEDLTHVEVSENAEDEAEEESDDAKSEDEDASKTEADETEADDWFSLEGLSEVMKESGKDLNEMPIEIPDGDSSIKSTLGEVIEWAHAAPRISKEYDQMKEAYTSQEGRHKEELDQVAMAYHNLKNFVLTKLVPDIDKDPGWLKYKEGTPEQQISYYRTRDFQQGVRAEIEKIADGASEDQAKLLNTNLDRQLADLQRQGVSRDMIQQNILPFLEHLGFSKHEIPYMMDARIIAPLMSGIDQARRIQELEKELADSKKQTQVKKLDRPRLVKGGKSTRSKNRQRLMNALNARMARGESLSPNDMAALGRAKRA